MKKHFFVLISVLLTLSLLFGNTAMHSLAVMASEDADAVVPIYIGDSRNVTISQASKIKYFSISPEEDVTVHFYSIGDCDTCGSIYNADMEELAFNDDSEDRNFSLTYKLDAGSSYILACKLFYTSVRGEFTVKLESASFDNAKTISACKVRVTEESEYDGEEKTPNIVVKDGIRTLVKNNDYIVSYSNNTNAGTALATVTGIGFYKDTIEKSFSITAKSIAGCDVTLGTDSYIFDGTQKTPAVTVKDGDDVLAQGKDYEVSYINHTNAGTATAIVTGMGNYKDFTEKSYTINAKPIAECSVTIEPLSYTYDGTEKMPELIVKDGETTLALDVDYTLTVNNNINAGTANVTVEGTGNYTGFVSQTFEITPKSISSCIIDLDASAFLYDGSEKRPAVSVMDGETQLEENTHYTLSYINNTEIGTAGALISGKGNYAGSVTKDFIITNKTIANCSVTLESDSYTYDGTAKTPAVTVKDGEDTLIKDTHYSVAYSGNIYVGTATVTITGNGIYTGVVSKTFTIAPKAVSDCRITLENTAYTYDGTAKTPSVTVKDGETTLEKDVHYTVTYSSNVNAGTASVIIEGMGNYTGTVTKTFTISQKSISGCTVSLGASSYYYDGAAKTPSVSVTDSGITLVSGTHYTVSYSNNTNIGTASAIITGTGNYTGSVTKTFTITCDSISYDTTKSVSIDTAGTVKYYRFVPSSNMTIEFFSTGSGDTYGYLYDANMTLLKSNDDGGEDHNFSLSHTVTANTVYYVACKYYSASTTGSFNIKISKYYETITFNTATSVSVSTGGEVKYFKFIPTSTMKIQFVSTGNCDTYGYIYDSNMTQLASNDDISSENRNFKVSCDVTANTTYYLACKLYSSTSTGSFSVKVEQYVAPKSISSCTVTLSQTSYNYDGNAKTPTVTVKDGSTTLSKGTHYTVSYSNNVNPGTATVTVIGVGNYTGSVTKNFTITRVTYNINYTNLTFNFGNRASDFGYQDNYKIPYERYSYIFGDNARARGYFNSEGTWGGSCFGMSAVSTMLNISGSGMSPQNWDKTIVWDIGATQWSYSLNMSMRDVIECMQVAQKGTIKSNARYAQNSNAAMLTEIRDAVENVKYTGKPVVLSISGKADGEDASHAVVAYSVTKNNDRESKINVYDPNRKNTQRQINLGTNPDGTVVAWSYYVGDYNWGTDWWGTGMGYDWIGYRNTDTIISVWKNGDRTASAAEANNVLTVSDNTFTVYDSSNTLVASVKNGELYTDDPEIYKDIPFANDIANHRVDTDKVTLYLPVGEYKVVTESKDGFYATMTNVERRATVKTSSDTITFKVDDNTDNNMACIYTDAGDTYEIFEECTCDNSEGEVKITGISKGGQVCVSMNDATLATKNTDGANVAINGVPVENTPSPLDTFSMTMPSGGIKGDVNFDGVIDINDVTYMQRSFANEFSLSEKQTKTADLVNDGQVSIGDATHLQGYLAGTKPLQ